MRNHVALTLDFGHGGNARAYQLDGWSVDESHFTWTLGESSSLRLPRPSAPYGSVLEIKCAPFTIPEKIAEQRLSVWVDGAQLSSSSLRYAGNLAFWLPSVVSDDDTMLVTIVHPDCIRPCDAFDSVETREIAFMVSSVRLLVLDEPVSLPAIRTSAIRLQSGLTRDDDLIAGAAAITGLPIVDLVTSFEALTGNCEFGFFQRRCGAEPLSLLRFAAGRVPLVLHGLDSGFEGIGNPEDLQARLSPSGLEWMIDEARYGLTYHTFTSPETVTREGMYPREAMRLRFLARKFLEDAAEGAKIFVSKDEFGLSNAEALALALALNRHGPCTLLWLTAADGTQQPGRVDAIAPRLLRGYMDRLSPAADPGDLSLAGWLSVCVNALLLHRQDIGGRT